MIAELCKYFTSKITINKGIALFTTNINSYSYSYSYIKDSYYYTALSHSAVAVLGGTARDRRSRLSVDSYPHLSPGVDEVIAQTREMSFLCIIVLQ